MTTRHKSFRAGKKNKEPVTFDIVDEESERVESFTAIPQVGGATLLDFIADADSDDGGRAASAIMDFITDAVVEEDRERFKEVLHDKDFIIEIGTLTEIVQYLVSEYTQSPTEASRPSASGLSTNGSGSTEPVSSAASTS